jgi:phosphoribosylformimino-5-aminoimidazole carboxamide ribotide isomerase
MTQFTIVPVLDLKDGVVVHAKAGNRADYRPIRSTLSASCDAGSVLAGLLSLAPFAKVYIADLDRIEGHGDQRKLIECLARSFEWIEFWVDGGANSIADALALADLGVVPVLGSETWPDAEALAEAVTILGSGGCLLSLDYRGTEFLGPKAISSMPTAWPKRVIAMTLSRVGSGTGPDLSRLATIQQMAGSRSVFAAGGVRHAADLAELKSIGAAGVLVASALHDGSLSGAEIAGVSNL